MANSFHFIHSYAVPNCELARSYGDLEHRCLLSVVNCNFGDHIDNKYKLKLTYKPDSPRNVRVGVAVRVRVKGTVGIRVRVGVGAGPGLRVGLGVGLWGLGFGLVLELVLGLQL